MMAKRGSITVFFSLMLSLILSLVCTQIESVRMAAARTQILNGLDIGLYSLFGQYDKKMLDEYDLFVLDGSFGRGELNMASVYDNLESYMKPVLKQNSQKLTIEQGGFTGYHLVTDDRGEAFYQQIVQYMQETLGSQGIQLLLDKMENREKKTREAEDTGKQASSGNALNSYDSEMNSAAQKSLQAEEAAKSQENGTMGDGQSPSDAFGDGNTKPVDNPITVIRRIMKMGILELVIPGGKTVSDHSVSKSELVSGRNLQQGMPMPDGIKAENSRTSQVMFQQYLINRLGNYRKPANGGLNYQIEYILGGKENDMDNLRAVAGKLLLIREGVNFACLAADTGRRMQAETLALAIASGFLIPPAAGAIEAALLVCWSFAESVLDVRELFDGGKVPLVKTPSDWQISLENLSRLLEDLDSSRRGTDRGMSYEDYLQVLLLSAGKEKKIMGAMDMIEQSIRKAGGREGFRLDSCIVAIEASVDVKANNRKVFNAVRQYCY